MGPTWRAIAEAGLCTPETWDRKIKIQDTPRDHRAHVATASSNPFTPLEILFMSIPARPPHSDPKPKPTEEAGKLTLVPNCSSHELTEHFLSPVYKSLLADLIKQQIKAMGLSVPVDSGAQGENVVVQKGKRKASKKIRQPTASVVTKSKSSTIAVVKAVVKPPKLPSPNFLHDNITTLLSLDPTSYDDVVFVALDSEFEGTRIGTSATTRIYTNRIRQLGFARLDTRKIAASLMSNLAAESCITTLLEAEQISIREDPKRAYLNLARGEYEKNTFGKYYSVPESEFDPVRLVTEALIIADSQSLNTRRKIILVGHGISSDLSVLNMSSEAGFCAVKLPKVIGVIDTSMIANDWKDSIWHTYAKPQRNTLEELVNAFQIPHEEHGFHHAGNDAVYSMKVLLMMAVQHQRSFLKVTRQDGVSIESTHSKRLDFLQAVAQSPGPVGKIYIGPPPKQTCKENEKKAAVLVQELEAEFQKTILAAPEDPWAAIKKHRESAETETSEREAETFESSLGNQGIAEGTLEEVTKESTQNDIIKDAEGSKGVKASKEENEVEITLERNQMQETVEVKKGMMDTLKRKLAKIGMKTPAETIGIEKETNMAGKRRRITNIWRKIVH